MKKKNILMSLASLAVAAVIGGCLTSCDDKVKPYITDANGDKWQVTSFGGYYFTYDEDGHLTSIIDNARTYFVDDDEFAFSSEDVEVKFKLDKNDNITKIVYTEENDEEFETEEGQFDFTYDSDKRLKSCKTVYKETEHNETWTFTSTTNLTWASNQLTINNEETVQGYDHGEGVSETERNTYVYTCNGQPNRSKQLPYQIGEMMTDLNDFGGLLTVLGLYGYGPDNLPTSYSRTRSRNGKETYSDEYEFDFVQNSNGTLQTEAYRFKGNSTWHIQEYNYSRTRADFVATQSLIDLVRNSMRQISLKHKAQKQ